MAYWVINDWGGHSEAWLDTDICPVLRSTHYKNPLPILIKKGEAMKHIVFEYMDRYTDGEWKRQECYMRSVDECIRVYGLGKDCSYRIISVEEVNE